MPRRVIVERDSASVQIEGLAEFIVEMKKASPALVSEVGLANWAVGKLIVIDAKKKANAIAWPGSSHTAAKTLGTTKSAKNAMVRLGGKRAPWAFGTEFGSKKFRQFDHWRGNQWVGFDSGVGYYLHPAIRESWPKVREEYLETLDRIMKTPFPD